MKIRYYLTLFIFSLKKTDRQFFKPTTGTNFILSIHREFENMWGYHLRLLLGQKFDRQREGLMTDFYEKICKVYAEVHHTQRHSFSSFTDLDKLFKRVLLSKVPLRGFQYLLGDYYW